MTRSVGAIGVQGMAPLGPSVPRLCGYLFILDRKNVERGVKAYIQKLTCQINGILNKLKSLYYMREIMHTMMFSVAIGR